MHWPGSSADFADIVFVWPAAETSMWEVFYVSVGSLGQWKRKNWKISNTHLGAAWVQTHRRRYVQANVNSKMKLWSVLEELKARLETCRCQGCKRNLKWEIYIWKQKENFDNPVGGMFIQETFISWPAVRANTQAPSRIQTPSNLMHLKKLFAHFTK